eukprot:7518567-Karenia_brevis.AAC.1
MHHMPTKQAFKDRWLFADSSERLGRRSSCNTGAHDCGGRCRMRLNANHNKRLNWQELRIGKAKETVVYRLE